MLPLSERERERVVESIGWNNSDDNNDDDEDDDDDDDNDNDNNNNNFNDNDDNDNDDNVNDSDKNNFNDNNDDGDDDVYNDNNIACFPIWDKQNENIEFRLLISAFVWNDTSEKNISHVPLWSFYTLLTSWATMDFSTGLRQLQMALHVPDVSQQYFSLPK